MSLIGAILVLIAISIALIVLLPILPISLAFSVVVDGTIEDSDGEVIGRLYDFAVREMRCSETNPGLLSFCVARSDIDRRGTASWLEAPLAEGPVLRLSYRLEIARRTDAAVVSATQPGSVNPVSRAPPAGP